MMNSDLSGKERNEDGAEGEAEVEVEAGAEADTKELAWTPGSAVCVMRLAI